MFLLDTCTFLWLVGDTKDLSEKVKSLIETNQDDLFISSMSAFEIGRKYHQQALELPLSPDKWFKQSLEYYSIIELPVTGIIALKSTELPPIHKDPIDRLIIATALEQRLKIITPNKHIQSYEAKTIW